MLNFFPFGFQVSHEMLRDVLEMDRQRDRQTEKEVGGKRGNRDKNKESKRQSYRNREVQHTDLFLTDRYNKDGAVSNAQKIQRWALLPLDFSQPTGELNNTLKLKRSFVQEKYKDIIESMYIPNKSLDVASKL